MYATLYIVKDFKKIPQLFPWRRIRGISRHILEEKKIKIFKISHYLSNHSRSSSFSTTNHVRFSNILYNP